MYFQRDWRLFMKIKICIFQKSKLFSNLETFRHRFVNSESKKKPGLQLGGATNKLLCNTCLLSLSKFLILQYNTLTDSDSCKKITSNTRTSSFSFKYNIASKDSLSTGSLFFFVKYSAVYQTKKLYQPVEFD